MAGFTIAQNYLSRHKHNVNRVLHIIGIPLVIIGIVFMVLREWRQGIIFFAIGYLFQWMGHSFFEKNELGEVILIKSIIKKCKGNKDAG